MALTTPTSEQAQQFSRKVDDSQAFVGTIMSPSAGSRGTSLFSLGMVDGFLVTHTLEEFQAAGLRLDIHYVDFGFLAQWFEEVIGDTELASEIRELHSTGEAFGQLVPRVKELLGTRLDQCDAVLNPKDAEPVPAGV